MVNKYLDDLALCDSICVSIDGEEKENDLNRGEGSFQKAMESLDYYDELIGNQITFGPNDHVGSKDIIISQIIEGNWKELLRK